MNKDNAEGRAPRHSKPGRGRQDRSMDVESTEAVKEKKARGR